MNRPAPVLGERWPKVPAVYGSRVGRASAPLAQFLSTPKAAATAARSENSRKRCFAYTKSTSFPARVNTVSRWRAGVPATPGCS